MSRAALLAFLAEHPAVDEVFNAADALVVFDAEEEPLIHETADLLATLEAHITRLRLALVVARVTR